jgi:hypothetical protein
MVVVEENSTGQAMDRHGCASSCKRVSTFCYFSGFPGGGWEIDDFLDQPIAPGKEHT